MKRVLQLGVDIGEWCHEHGTTWRVVAIDLDAGALHLERVEEGDETILGLYKRIARIVAGATPGFSLDIEGPMVRLKCRTPKAVKPPKVATGRSPESKAPTGRSPKPGPGRRP